jgi:hypothetical protein
MGACFKEIAMNILERLETRDSNERDVLEYKIKLLLNAAWRDKWRWESDQLSKWLGNFKDNERLNAMFLLSKFMYFNNETIRELMIRVYEDLYKRPIIHEIRRKNGHTRDSGIIEREFKKVNRNTRFLSIGNPSESSAHLLYFFRQENGLKRDLFIGQQELFAHDVGKGEITATMAIKDIERIIVLDDFCGSGNQATDFNDKVVKFIKMKNKNLFVAYYSLFATENGIKKLQGLSFDSVESVFVLDDSYKCFSERSRYFDGEDVKLKIPCKSMCEEYGKKISKIPLGYKDCQLMLGFHHNTPNNTLPIFWQESNGWQPIFKRFAKLY